MSSNRLIEFTHSHLKGLTFHLAAWAYIHSNQEDLAIWHGKFVRDNFFERKWGTPEYSSLVMYAENEEEWGRRK